MTVRAWPGEGGGLGGGVRDGGGVGKIAGATVVSGDHRKVRCYTVLVQVPPERRPSMQIPLQQDLIPLEAAEEGRVCALLGIDADREGLVRRRACI